MIQDLCQYFTPPGVAREFLAWTGVSDDELVVEPAAGEGSLCPNRPGVLAIELDTALLPELRYWRPEAEILCTDFLTLEPFLRADVAIQNPPYSGDGEGRFIHRALSWAPRCCALVRTVALHGKGRFELCWQYVRPTRIAILKNRPRYVGPGGAATAFTPEADYMAIECVLRSKPLNDYEDFSVEVQVDWVNWR